jgi:hypothetical protein
MVIQDEGPRKRIKGQSANLDAERKKKQEEVYDGAERVG